MFLEALESRLFLDSTLHVVLTRNPDPAAGYESYTVHFVATTAADELGSFDGAFVGAMKQVWTFDNALPTSTFDTANGLSPASLALDSHLLLSSANLLSQKAPTEDRAGTGLGTYLGGPGGYTDTMAIGLRGDTRSTDLLFAQIVIPTGGAVHLVGNAGTDTSSVPIDFWIEDSTMIPTMDLKATPLTPAENAAPVALAPTATLTEPRTAPAGATLKFSLGGATTGDLFQIANQGSAAGQVGVSGANVSYGGTVVGTFTGGVNGADLAVTFNADATSAAIGAVLRDVTFTNTSAAPPLTQRFATVTYVSPSGRVLTGSPVSVTLTAINDPPVLTVPGALSVVENTPVVFSDALGRAIGITDPDVGLGYMRITLDATHGTLSLATTVGVTIVSGSATNSSHIVFDATRVTAVATLNGLTLTPAENYIGDATLSVLVSDKGNYGSGGAKTDSDSVTVTLTENLGPNQVPTAGDLTTTVDLSKATQFTLPIHDAESSAAHLVVTITSGPTSGTLTLLDSGVVSYTPSGHVTGTDSFTYTVSDDGLGGTGGVMTSSEATVTLTLGRQQTLDAKGKLTYLDGTGKLVNVTLTGGGGATLYFDSASGSDPVRMEVTGTTSKSALTIAPVVKKTYTTIGDIVVSGPIGKITGGSCDLHGAVVSIGTTLDTKAATLIFHNVLNSSITSAMPLASLTVLDWQDTDGTADLITATRLDKLTSTGGLGFGADLSLSGSLGTAKVTGNLSGVNWGVAGIKSLTVTGTADTSVIRSDHGIAGMTFGAVSHTDVLAGVAGVVRHAAANGDFLDTVASIGKITIKGWSVGKKTPQMSGLQFFVDSNFSAASIGTASVLNADLTTTDGLWVRNTITPKPVKSVSYKDALAKWTYTTGADSHGLVHLIDLA